MSSPHGACWGFPPWLLVMGRVLRVPCALGIGPGLGVAQVGLSSVLPGGVLVPMDTLPGPWLTWASVSPSVPLVSGCLPGQVLVVWAI